MSGVEGWDQNLDLTREATEVDEFNLWKDLGNQSLRRGDFERAEQAYARAESLKPDSDVLKVNLGTLAIQRGDVSQAVDHFRDAVRINPENDRGWLGLALVHRSFGDIDLAWANLEKSIDLNPELESGLWLAVDWAQRDGRFSWTLEKLTAHTQKWQHQSPFGLSLVRLLLDCGRIYQAQAQLQSVVDLRGRCSLAQELESELRSLLKVQAHRL